MEKKANTSVENRDLRFLTRELLTNAQALLEEIQEMVEHCCSIPSPRRKTDQRVHVPTIREDRETLVIDGFRFDDADSREDLGRQKKRKGKNNKHD